MYLVAVTGMTPMGYYMYLRGVSTSMESRSLLLHPLARNRENNKISRLEILLLVLTRDIHTYNIAVYVYTRCVIPLAHNCRTQSDYRKPTYSVKGKI